MNTTNNTTRALKRISFFVFFVVLQYSCNQSKNGEKDPKDISTEHNEDKFENSDKEKDSRFVVEAAIINLTEIRLGKLAQQKAIASDVRDLAKMVQKEHLTAEDELQSLASVKIITIPDSTTRQVQDAYQRLNAKSGKEFDSAFCDMMIEGHKNAIALFEKASKETIDSDIKSLATSTLPVLRDHLDRALSCKEKCEQEAKAKEEGGF